jgi:hypothetical protein
MPRRTPPYNAWPRLWAVDRRGIHGQVVLRKEVLDLRGVCGIPLTVWANGWRAEPLDWLEPDEVRAVKKSTESIEQFISEILIEAVRSDFAG